MYNDGSRQPMSGDIVSIHTQRFCGGSGTNVSKLQWAMYDYVSEPQINFCRFEKMQFRWEKITKSL